MKFTKMHGAGNDYVYVDARDPGLKSTDWSSLALEMSDRHFGIGSDGLILLVDSEVGDIGMRMFNADGSEGDMCGNGLRCIAKYAIDRRIALTGDADLKVETASGVRQVEPITKNGVIVGARVSMGHPQLEPSLIPVLVSDKSIPTVKGAIVDYPVDISGSTIHLGFVSMGNPHAVSFIEGAVDLYPLGVIGPEVETCPIFPNKVNFEIVSVIDRSNVRARVWERGSGETMACGSGACAIAVISRILGFTDDIVQVALPGGTLRIIWDGESEVYMEGNAVEVFEGEWIRSGVKKEG